LTSGQVGFKFNYTLATICFNKTSHLLVFAGTHSYMSS